MTNTPMYQPDELAAVVWPRQHAPRVLAGEITWQDAVSGGDTRWIIDADKADRSRILIAVYEDVIQDALRITDCANWKAVPPGGSRSMNHARFQTVPDPRLAYLRGLTSPLLRRRNPQTVVPIRDLPGAQQLLTATEPPDNGVVQLAGYTLVVHEDGTAELRTPPGAVLTVRAA